MHAAGRAPGPSSAWVSAEWEGRDGEELSGWAAGPWSSRLLEGAQRLEGLALGPLPLKALLCRLKLGLEARECFVESGLRRVRLLL